MALSRKERADALAILAGNGYIHKTSYGCGSRTKLAYRLFYPRSKEKTSVIGFNGESLEGSISDDSLLDLCRLAVEGLNTIIAGGSHDDVQG